jgi:hypothetical protein
MFDSTSTPRNNTEFQDNKNKKTILQYGRVEKRRNPREIKRINKIFKKFHKRQNPLADGPVSKSTVQKLNGGRKNKKTIPALERIFNTIEAKTPLRSRRQT